MTLISSVSGIRGTVGGKPAKNLTPIDVVLFTSSFAFLVQSKYDFDCSLIVGRDARKSGPMIQELVMNTLIGMGITVFDIGLTTTPSLEMEILRKKSQGGIIITASHNPENWNALKLLNSRGELISMKDNDEILKIKENKLFKYSPHDKLGSIIKVNDAINNHITDILNLPIINVSAIKYCNFSGVVDGINSSGGIAVPMLLEKLNVNVKKINCVPNGIFTHNPEPLKENLTELCDIVKKNKSNFGIAVDPDVDRLVFVDEMGEMFGEEYTLVACSDYVLSKSPGSIVSNLSSSRALPDLAKQYGVNHFSSAVGEFHVVEKMKAVKAVIGGEGNGGVIYPKLHYGRDALVGIALFLSLLAEKKVGVSALKNKYTNYVMRKTKINLNNDIKVDLILKKIAKKFENFNISESDGVKVDFEDSWIHLRKSNTEPIIRLYAEGKEMNHVDEIIKEIKELIKNYSS